MEVQPPGKGDSSNRAAAWLWEALTRDLTFLSLGICFWAALSSLVFAWAMLQGRCAILPWLRLADLAPCVDLRPTSSPGLVWQTQVPWPPGSLSQPHITLYIRMWWTCILVSGSLSLSTLWCLVLVHLPLQSSLPLLLPDTCVENCQREQISLKWWTSSRRSRSAY